MGVPDDRARAILALVRDGRGLYEILQAHPEWTGADVRAAAEAALRALDGQPAAGARIETRQQRIERLRQRCPKAYAPWDAEEDALLVRRWIEGSKVAHLARELGRQPNAVRARLEKRLGPNWKEVRALPPAGQPSARP